MLSQVVLVFLIFSVALYVAAGAAPGTVIVIGLGGKLVYGTFTNPAVIAAALKSIVYWSGGGNETLRSPLSQTGLYVVPE